MKTLTPKERREIYLKAYEIVIHRSGVCYTLLELAYPLEFIHSDEAIKLFPEFGLFEPLTKQLCYPMWWKYTDMDSRANCLLFCAELTKTAKQ